MNVSVYLQQAVSHAFHDLFGVTIAPEDIIVTETKKEFEGDFTVTCFNLTRFSKKSPQATAASLGEYLQKRSPIVQAFQALNGFLNLTIKDSYWIDFLARSYAIDVPLPTPRQRESIMLEYCSPNTNKPLHLGHIRNCLLGHSLAEILKANGYRVMKVNLINDRGIHICKSMLAWQKWGQGQTPNSTGMKGDHFVGKYYVLFEEEYRKECEALQKKGMREEEAMQQAPLMQEAQELLRKWEAGDKQVRVLWKQMNEWVYAGFDVTYKKLNIDFDKIYYESETYLSGKQMVQEGLNKKIFYKKDDGSVWVDLRDEGLEEKVLLRSDGTSVYITQDIGTIEQRHREYKMDKYIYVVGNEQDYHFRALRVIMKKLNKSYATAIEHFSYGMVNLPTGKMKSREGTVVDADDLIQEMEETAEKHTLELGKIEDLSQEEARQLYRIIGMGALKFFILKVDPRKNILFNPQESIDFHGFTGPFVQYAYTRIRSLMRKAEENKLCISPEKITLVASLHPLEREVIILSYKFPQVVAEAGREYAPSIITHYVYQLAKAYNQLYAELPILNAEKTERVHLRLALSMLTANVIRTAMKLLGIQVPERM